MIHKLPILYRDLYPVVTGRQPPAEAVRRESDADVLSPGRGFIRAFDYTMQLQVGCSAGCLYCYVPASPRLTPVNVRKNWGYEVRTKKRAAEKFRRHLGRGKLADKTVYWSGVTDPYAAPAALTRSIWEILNGTDQQLRPRRLAVQSRFAVERDAARIADYCRSTNSLDGGPPVVVSYSIGTDRTDVIRSWERATPSFERRMQTVQALRRAGLWVVVTLSPFGPWRNLRATLQQLRDWGVAYVTAIFFKQENSCASTPALFLAHLRRDWPDLLDPAWQAERVSEIEEVFGAGRVLLEQHGFSTLGAPHLVVESQAPRAATGCR